MTEDDLNFMRAQIMQAILYASPPMVRRIHEALGLAVQERAVECDEVYSAPMVGEMTETAVRRAGD